MTDPSPARIAPQCPECRLPMRAHACRGEDGVCPSDWWRCGECRVLVDRGRRRIAKGVESRWPA